MSTVNEKMTSICDAIRSVTGITSKLGIDEIVNEIEDLTGGVSKNYATGTIIPMSSSTQLISHGLGRVPDIIIFFKLYSKENSATSSEPSIVETVFSGIFSDIAVGCNIGSRYYTSSSYYPKTQSTSTYNKTSLSNAKTTTYYITNITEEQFRSPSSLVEGRNYAWIAIKGV